MIHLVVDPFVLAVEACLAVLAFDLFQGLWDGWRGAQSDDLEHSL